jgi:hypothetical protein
MSTFPLGTIPESIASLEETSQTDSSTSMHTLTTLTNWLHIKPSQRRESILAEIQDTEPPKQQLSTLRNAYSELLKKWNLSCEYAEQTNADANELFRQGKIIEQERDTAYAELDDIHSDSVELHSVVNSLNCQF